MTFLNCFEKVTLAVVQEKDHGKVKSGSRNVAQKPRWELVVAFPRWSAHVQQNWSRTDHAL